MKSGLEFQSDNLDVAEVAAKIQIPESSEADVDPDALIESIGGSSSVQSTPSSGGSTLFGDAGDSARSYAALASDELGHGGSDEASRGSSAGCRS